MKIIFKDAKEVEIKDLKNGVAFVDPEIDDCTVFIKVRPNLELEIKTDVDYVGKEYTSFAIDLYTGELYGFDDEDKVIPVEIEATVTR